MKATEAEIERVKTGLKHHIQQLCDGCPYSDKPSGCLLECLLPETMSVINALRDENLEKSEHINRLHGGIEALRDAMMGETKHGRH